MFALEDCIALCGLTEEEVLAIAEHEHLPEIVACALAEYLLHQEHGPVRIRDMIVDDVRAAQERGNREHVRTLLHVLHHFLRAHPHALPLRHDERQASWGACMSAIGAEPATRDVVIGRERFEGVPAQMEETFAR